MKRFGLALLAVLALVVVAARPAMTQMRQGGGLQYGVSAGLLMPMGDYGDFDKMGFVAGAGVTKWLPAGNIGVRADLSYSQTSHDVEDGNTKLIGGLASVVYALQPASAPARVMLTGGLGYYNVKIDEAGDTFSESKIGFGVGAAVAFKLGTGSTRAVVGTRFTSVSTSGSSITFLPITVGLTFGR
jgi:hypothetical protein